MYLSLIVDKLFKVTRQVSITLGVAGLKPVDHPKPVYLMLKPEHSDKQILILRRCACLSNFVHLQIYMLFTFAVIVVLCCLLIICYLKNQ